MVRTVLAALLVLALAAGAVAEHRHTPVANDDANYNKIDETSPHTWGRKFASVAYYDSLFTKAGVANWDTAGTGSINPGSTAIPKWFCFQVPTEANLTELHIAFEEMNPSATSVLDSVTFAWGDTMIYYVGGAAVNECLPIGLWRRARLWAKGSSAGLVDIYLWVESYRD